MEVGLHGTRRGMLIVGLIAFDVGNGLITLPTTSEAMATRASQLAIHRSGDETASAATSSAASLIGCHGHRCSPFSGVQPSQLSFMAYACDSSSRASLLVS